MKKKLLELLNIKNIIVITMLFAFIYGWINGMINSAEFIPLITIIISFYFVKNKKNKEEKKNGNNK